ncbi:MAG: hypothetical protein KDD14_21640 [Saprospiraceae bacterium]|nr:hypothetical protein [Saprospiraceae bacterium]
MRWIVRFFTVYMIALSLVPCGDGGGGIVEIANHFLGVEHLENADHNPHSNTCNDDPCSPFCICRCCSTAMDYPVKSPALAAPHLLPPVKKLFCTDKFTLSSFLASIWQPPQFC